MQKWVALFSACGSLIAIAAGIVASLREYRLKLAVERRAKQTADIEAEIRLQTRFAELMNVANGRGGYSL